MTMRSEITAAREQWRLLTFYERFEQAVVLILTTLIAIVVAPAVWNLALKIIFTLLLTGAFDPSDNAVFQALFGMIFTVIIALEFKRSVLVIAARRDSIVQVRTVVLLTMLAVMRKLIILDLNTTDTAKILSLNGRSELRLQISGPARSSRDRPCHPSRKRRSSSLSGATRCCHSMTASMLCSRRSRI